jgi:hypothetical protein
VVREARKTAERSEPATNGAIQNALGRISQSSHAECPRLPVARSRPPGIR